MFQKKKKKTIDIPDEDYKKLLDDILNDPALSGADNDAKNDDAHIEHAEAEPAPESTALTKWKISELNDLTDEFSTEKMSEENIDEKLLLALGYLSQSEDADLLDRTVKIKEHVFGLKKEFSDEREIPTIKARFEKEKKALKIRLTATVAIAFIILLYPAIASVLSGTIAFFDTQRFFLANMFAVLQLLLIAAAFSGRDLSKGLIKTLLLRPNVYSPPAILIVSSCLTEILFAFTVKDFSGFGVTMYTLPVACSLILPIISDIMRMRVQEKTFDRVNAHATEGKDVFHLSESGNGIVLEKNGKDIDFYKRTRMQHSDPKVMNFALIPGFVLSVIAGLYTYFVSKDAGSAFSVASVSLCVVIPGAMIMNYYPFFFVSDSVLDKADASIVGRSSIAPLSECDCITVNEEDMFEAHNGNSMTMDMYEIDQFFDVFYYGACVLKSSSSALANLFLANAEDLELSDNVTMQSLTNDGISALVDGKTLIHMGNEKYMNACGISIPEKKVSDGDAYERKPSFVLYIAKNGTLIAKSNVFYTQSRDFMRISEMIKNSSLKLRILSSDFVITSELISEMFNLSPDEFELVKLNESVKHSNKRSSLAVAIDNPSPLFAMREIGSSICSAEKAIHSCSVFTSVFAAVIAVLVTVFSLTGISPLLVLLFNAVMLLPSFVMAKLHTSHFSR